MSLLQVYLFGSVRVVHTGRSSDVKVTHIAQSLLAYLLLQRNRSYPREVLANLLWGDHCQSQALGCLSTALWRLRGILEPEGICRGTYLVLTASGEVSFNWESDYWLDMSAFAEQLGRIVGQPTNTLCSADVQDLMEALQLYSGELLESLYDDWAIREREHLHYLYLRGVAKLMDYYKNQGDYEESLACGRQILGYEPLREDIHRQMMCLYMESGQRAQAVRQYETCWNILSSELGISPMEETQALYAQIVPEDEHSLLQSESARQSDRLHQALEQCYTALHNFDEARRQLQLAIQIIEGRANAKD